MAHIEPCGDDVIKGNYEIRKEKWKKGEPHL